MGCWPDSRLAVVCCWHEFSLSPAGQAISPSTASTGFEGCAVTTAVCAEVAGEEAPPELEAVTATLSVEPTSAEATV